MVRVPRVQGQAVAVLIDRGLPFIGLFRVPCGSALRRSLELGRCTCLPVILAALSRDQGRQWPRSGPQALPLTAAGAGEMVSNDRQASCSVLMFATHPHDCRKSPFYCGEVLIH